MKAPAMVPGNVEMVSVAWIMQNAQWSVDYFNDHEGGVDYERMALDKGADWQFSSLVSTILKKGFRVPIVLCLNYGRYDDARRNVVHGNGHHRMVAALLLCLDEIPVYWSDYAASEDYMCTRTSTAGPLNQNLNVVNDLWEKGVSPWH